MPTAVVRTGARLHFGFCNLSLSHERLYGGLGVGLDGPEAVVAADPAADVTAPDPLSEAARRSVEVLGVEGAAVEARGLLPRHVGLGSGTQHALATYAAVAAAHGVRSGTVDAGDGDEATADAGDGGEATADREDGGEATGRAPTAREAAPALGRGGRSGVGVGAFEAGGVVMDAGHSTARFTDAPPADGEWTVPAVAARRPVPGDWRFLLVTPAVDPGRSGDDEDRSMRAAVRDADPAVADRIAAVVVRRLLPAVAEGDHVAFGDAVAEVSRLNGSWYADEQGGVFRPPVGPIVDSLSAAPAVTGAGQSSWGPTAYGVTRAADADAARAAGRRALDAAGVEGTVRVVPAGGGADVDAADRT